MEFVFSTDVQLSDPPLSGKYYLKCADTTGTFYATNDIDITSDANRVKSLLENDCSFLKDKISVRQLTDTHSSNKMGVEFEVHFHGMAGSLEMYEMKSAIDEPLVGVNIEYA